MAEPPMSLPEIQILAFFCTCNPPHVGHVHAVTSALRSVPRLEKLLIIPPLHHVWGKAIADYQQRIEMAHLAFDPVDARIEVSRLENDDDLSGYTIDSLHRLLALYPGKRIGILVGADTLATFPKWRDWQAILSAAILIVAPRDEHKQQDVIVSLDDRLVPYLGKSLFFLPDGTDQVALGMSSTKVRRRILREQTLGVPDAVRTYISATKVYVNQHA